MKKNRWGFLNICVAAIIAAGGAVLATNSTQADTDTGSGTATVTFTGGSQIMQVPNFDFGKDNQPNGVGLFSLIGTAGSGVGSDPSFNNTVRALTVRVPNQSAASTAEDGWSVSAQYQPDQSANAADTTAANASIVFNSPTVTGTTQTGGVTVLIGDDNGVFADTKWASTHQETWVINTLPAGDQHYMDGSAVTKPSISEIKYSGFIPIGWQPTGTYTGITVFGRTTNKIDPSLVTDDTHTNPYYRLNFPFKDSAQIYVPLKSQIANFNKVLTGNLVWTLSKGAPAYGWPDGTSGS